MTVKHLVQHQPHRAYGATFTRKCVDHIVHVFQTYSTQQKEKRLRFVHFVRNVCFRSIPIHF